MHTNSFKMISISKYSKIYNSSIEELKIDDFIDLFKEDRSEKIVLRKTSLKDAYF